jgi:hypothetical protein
MSKLVTAPTVGTPNDCAILESSNYGTIFTSIPLSFNASSTPSIKTSSISVPARTMGSVASLIWSRGIVFTVQCLGLVL